MTKLYSIFYTDSDGSCNELCASNPALACDMAMEMSLAYGEATLDMGDTEIMYRAGKRV